MQSIFARYLAYNIGTLLPIQSINTVYFASCINTCITSFNVTDAKATYSIIANKEVLAPIDSFDL